MKKLLLLCVIVVTSCTRYESSFSVRPESLVSNSAEKISFPLSTDTASVNAVDAWIKSGELPATADLTCNQADNCKKIRKILSKYNVKVNEIADQSTDASSLSLNYNRLITKNCATGVFGCATSINSVHMVVNHEPLTKPANFKDAASAIKAIER